MAEEHQSVTGDIGVSETNSGPKFVAYFVPLVNALRALGGNGTPDEVVAWIKENENVPADEIAATTKGGKPSFKNRVSWARFYLSKDGLIDATERGNWKLTPDGLEAKLDHQKALEIFKRVHLHFQNEPDDEAEVPDEYDVQGTLFPEKRQIQYWFAGAVWDDVDKLQDFLSKGIWQNGYDDKFSNLVDRIQPGDKIAIKSSFVRKLNLPFDVGGKTASCMRIKAIGTVIENKGDHKTITVDWDQNYPDRDWFFYTYRTTLVQADPNDNLAKQLIDFAFNGVNQNYSFWLAQPYFVKKYFSNTTPDDGLMPDADKNTDIVKAEYTVDSILNEGCFYSSDFLADALSRLREKKNLILQGPPGTGKTWLAKRLGYALIGIQEKSKLRVVQFHPSLSYEDFVRGWRPGADGKLCLSNGVFLNAIQEAIITPDVEFVFIIEEINRGNPAQIFGEMLTLLENGKRKEEESIELAYQKTGETVVEDNNVYIPPNFYVIGTMNIADRSLALVDLALRRRFAFVDLEPQFGELWKEWCRKKGIDEKMLVHVADKMKAMNQIIKQDKSLGEQYRVGHSFVTPEEYIVNPLEWFRKIVQTEIKPLLKEYWFDAPEKAEQTAKGLLDEL